MVQSVITNRDDQRMPVLKDILAQPDALELVAHHLLGDGLPAMDNATKLIKAADHIIVSAIGASYNACLPFVHQLRSIGLSVQIIDAAELLYNPGVLARTCALYILVSRSGESIEIVKLLKILNQREATVIGIANEIDSYLVQNSVCPIILNSPVDHSVAIKTFTGTLLAFAMLFEMLIKELSPKEFAEEIQNFINGLSEHIATFTQLSGNWNEFLTPASVIYLLGRGPSLSAVHEGALLFHEMAKLPAIGMGSGSFRHGAVEVVDENFCGIIFSSNGITKDLDIALAEVLVEFGAKVCIVGDCNGLNPSIDRFECWHIGSRYPIFTPILEVIPVQLAAFRLASWLKKSPGKFRYLNSVVDDEIKFGKIEAK
jgi:glucosamine--fructose-6-phosphate aminotransferase (isomerizing)